MSSPDENVRRVMDLCPGCSEDTGSSCLELCGNDVEKAVQKYVEIEEFLPPDPPSSDDSTPSQSSNDRNHEDEADALDEPPKDQRDSVEEDRPWMFKLLSLPVPTAFPSNGPQDPRIFELRELVGAILAGHLDADGVRNYLGCYDKETLDANLNAEIEGCPAMFYIVSTNDIGIIREWVKYGGNPNATWGHDALPLIAFSVLSGGQTLLQASRVLATLLRFGADPRVIPRAFYDPYCRDLPEDGPVQEELDDIGDDNKRWCTADLRVHLTEALTLTQRYDLYRSSKIQPHSGREKKLLARQGAGEVLGLHQMIVSQSIATRWLQRKLLVYLALQRKKPLILVFAGPSGHGKTELAKRFGDLMSLELQVVDCTIFKQDNELFGPRPPYSGHEDGSPLNNFLARKAGERCIVFMDEFEKTSKDIHNTLLLPFQDGRYEDRRNGRIVDCSKTIWILATNKLDDSIHDFCNANEKALFQTEEEDAQDKVVGKLCRQLRKEFIEQFDAPLGGRISEILPFLVFSPQESPVIVHKALMNFEAEVARRVRLTLNREEDVYVGNIVIRIKNDATVCCTIARDEYDKKTGARSIAQAVERIVQDPLTTLYLKNGDDFDENQPTSHFEINVNVDEEVEVRLVVR
ncbi:P-loop containing nucleoside triphosphate hydrolase protein [Hypoxylon cercidicola]|nr:P-loop containing nucleoside triphosphate hydrolase protein [Hypoxylon cercidicola]